MRTLFLISIVWFAPAAFANISPIPDVKSQVLQLRNDGVEWSGGFGGLEVRSIGENGQKVLATGPLGVPYLLEALKDERRFVIAHVILTMQCDSWTSTGGEWNGLEVHLYSDGQVFIPTSKMRNIQRFWAQRF